MQQRFSAARGIAGGGVEPETQSNLITISRAKRSKTHPKKEFRGVDGPF